MRTILAWMVIVCWSGSIVAQEPASRPADSATSACSACSGKESVACPTCDGKGKATLTCIQCAGNGSAPCGFCRSIEKILKTTRPDMKLGLGRVPCPNSVCDKKGQMKWEDGRKQQCRVCDGKGSFKCVLCRDGDTKCSLCLGRGKTDQVCGDCAGRGSLTCIVCKPDARDRCPQCSGRQVHQCTVCRGGTGSGRKCSECLAEGKVMCPNCHGLKRLSCRGCGGSGQMRYETSDGKSAGQKKHEPCEGKGFTACEECAASGRVDCKECEKGAIADACPWCDKGKVYCLGCALGRWRGVETYGRAYAALGRHAEAAKLFEAAAARAPNDLATLIKALEASDDQVRKATAQYFRTLQKDVATRLQARITAAKASKPQPGPPAKGF